MNRKKQLFLLLMLGIACGSIIAQTQSAIDDIKKLNAQFAAHRYEFLLVYDLYETYSSQVPVETQKLDVKMWDMMVNLKSRQFHVIRNKEFYLYVNPDQEVIMLNSVKAYSKELKQLKDLEQLINIDTIVKTYQKVEELKPANGLRTYRFYMAKNFQYAYADLTFNPQSYLLSKVVIYYAKGLDELYGIATSPQKNAKLPRLEMNFVNFRTVSTFVPDHFSIAPYITRKGKQYQPVSGYRNFQFINNTY